MDAERIELTEFFPDYIRVTGTIVSDDCVSISIKSQTHTCACPLCGQISHRYHSTYVRSIQDLPILGKQTRLKITAYRYYCENDKCEQKVFAEELGGFAGSYRRMTERLEALVSAVALNTSCEGASMICKQMGIAISGDTLIKILLRNAEKVTPVCVSLVGVDDWAYRKGHTYGTIICDGATHKPVALVDGRDGRELKEWLKENKHIKMVTRDRAGTYAKAITEVLPDCIQIADRFHLFQNLADAVRKAVTSITPSRIEMPVKAEEMAMGITLKKRQKRVDTIRIIG